MKYFKIRKMDLSNITQDESTYIPSGPKKNISEIELKKTCTNLIPSETEEKEAIIVMFESRID